VQSTPGWESIPLLTTIALSWAGQQGNLCATSESRTTLTHNAHHLLLGFRGSSQRQRNSFADQKPELSLLV
jgi:hypothetical protein